MGWQFSLFMDLLIICYIYFSLTQLQMVFIGVSINFNDKKKKILTAFWPTFADWACGYFQCLHWIQSVFYTNVCVLALKVHTNPDKRNVSRTRTNWHTKWLKSFIVIINEWVSHQISLISLFSPGSASSSPTNSSSSTRIKDRRWTCSGNASHSR